jgi:hypothetical protein
VREEESGLFLILKINRSKQIRRNVSNGWFNECGAKYFRRRRKCDAAHHHLYCWDYF